MLRDSPALLGRAALLADIDVRLAAGGGVTLYGPPGIGKSALLDAVTEQAAARGELILRLRPARGERTLAYAGIADLVRQVPPDVVASLAPAARTALAALRQGR
ncbi:AAA family ATPase, partial [Actinoplanes cyaneus]